MMKEYKRELLKSKLKKHPVIPFVYYYGNRLYCIEHLNSTPMNHGAMKQHVEGKAHRINFSTGEPMVNSDIPIEILSILELKKEKIQTKPNTDKFWDLKAKLDVMFPEDEYTKRKILADYGFDGMKKWDVKHGLKVERDLKEWEKIFKMMDYVGTKTG